MSRPQERMKFVPVLLLIFAGCVACAQAPGDELTVPLCTLSRAPCRDAIARGALGDPCVTGNDCEGWPERAWCRTGFTARKVGVCTTGCDDPIGDECSYSCNDDAACGPFVCVTGNQCLLPCETQSDCAASIHCINNFCAPE